MSADTLQSLVSYLHVDVFSIVVMLLQRLILGYIICESSETHQISIYTNQFISTNIITGRVHSFLRHKKQARRPPNHSPFLIKSATFSARASIWTY